MTWRPATFTWDGSAVTGSEASWTGTHTPYYSVATTALPTAASELAAQYTGIVEVAMLTLVHGGNDTEVGQSTSGDSSSSEGGDSGSDDAESAAAPGVGARDVGKVVTAWVVAALIGALAIFPS